MQRPTSKSKQLEAKWKGSTGSKSGADGSSGSANPFKDKVKLKSTGTTKPWMKEKNGSNAGAEGGGAPSWKKSPFGKKKPSVGSTIMSVAQTGSAGKNNVASKWNTPGKASSSASTIAAAPASPSSKKKKNVFGMNTTTTATSTTKSPTWKKKTSVGGTVASSRKDGSSSANNKSPIWKKMKAAVSPTRSPKSGVRKSSFKLKKSLPFLAKDDDDDDDDASKEKEVKPAHSLKKKKPSLKKKSALDEKQVAPEKLLLDGVVRKLVDKKKHEKQIETLVNRIKAAGGFPQRRRLSLRDNDIVTSLNKVIMNDPSVTEIHIEEDPRFQHVPKSLLLEFAEGIRANMYLETLSIKGCDLDNCFLSALSTSVESNFTLDTVILPNNGFTSDALVEFCQALGVNETIKRVDLREQISPILGTADPVVIEALRKNRVVEKLRIDVKSTELRSAIKAIVSRNKEKPVAVEDADRKLIDYLEKEAARAEELQQQRELESKVFDAQGDDDWSYLHELSELANKYKLAEMTDDDKNDSNADADVGGFRSRQASLQKMLGPGTAVNFTSDGAFLTNDFISSFLVEEAECGSLTFAFQSQTKLFKRFPIGDAKRKFISKMFAETLLNHPRAKDITHINMANSGCGDEWLCRLCQKCLSDPSLLPRLHLLNIETNFITEAGVIALSKCIASTDTFKYLQAIKLENQRHLISSRAELELAKALCGNRSVIRLSFRVRNLWERDQINKFLARNMDFLRQARMKHAIQTGTHVKRARNKMEQLFDQVAADDPSVTEVEVVGNQLFLSLPRDEVLKAAKSFATNTHVKTVRMTMLKLDDKFASTLAESLETNTHCGIEKLILDSNMISSQGITSLVGCLSKNTSIVELQLRHQSKPLGSAEEEKLAGLLGDNNTLTKLGIDLRGLLAQNELDRKMSKNRELARKARKAAEASGGTEGDGKSTTTKKKKQGPMQQLFEKVANDDPSVTEVSITGEKLFLTLGREDRLAAARSFATNGTVKSVRMTMLQLDDDFACALAESMQANTSIESLVLDSNLLTGKGIKAIIGSLGSNGKSMCKEVQLRHQKKPMSTSDQEALPGLLGDNGKLTKCGVDLRSQMAQREIDNRMAKNRERQREKKANKKLSKKESL